jgi:Holliday junction resolvase
MSGRHSRNKGANYEREVARIFREHCGFTEEECKRGIGQARVGSEVADVELPLPLWLECKRGKKTYPKKALEQAVEALAKNKRGKMPVAICRDDNSKATATMYLEDFLNLVFPKKKENE